MPRESKPQRRLDRIFKSWSWLIQTITSVDLLRRYLCFYPYSRSSERRESRTCNRECYTVIYFRSDFMLAIQFPDIIFTLTSIEMRRISPVWCVSSGNRRKFLRLDWLFLRKINSARSTSYARRILIAVSRYDFLSLHQYWIYSRHVRVVQVCTTELHQIHEVHQAHLLPTSVTPKNQTSKVSE